jgi:hypothetical protein
VTWEFPYRKPLDPGLTVAEMKRCVWVKPSMVCEVKFTEWTQDDRLRQPVFLGLRDDKSASEVVREEIPRQLPRLLRQGTAIWNDWRIRNPESLPNLSWANLTGANFCQTDLTGANLCRANLSRVPSSGRTSALRTSPELTWHGRHSYSHVCAQRRSAARTGREGTGRHDSSPAADEESNSCSSDIAGRIRGWSNRS